MELKKLFTCAVMCALLMLCASYALAQEARHQRPGQVLYHLGRNVFLPGVQSRLPRCRGDAFHSQRGCFGR